MISIYEQQRANCFISEWAFCVELTSRAHAHTQMHRSQPNIRRRNWNASVERSVAHKSERKRTLDNVERWSQAIYEKCAETFISAN